MNDIIDSETLNQLQPYIHELEQYLTQRDDIAHANIQVYLERDKGDTKYRYYMVNNTANFQAVFWLDRHDRLPLPSLYTVEDTSEIVFLPDESYIHHAWYRQISIYSHNIGGIVTFFHIVWRWGKVFSMT